MDGPAKPPTTTPPRQRVLQILFVIAAVQTLNQLLAEMDGFDATTGVILMAATNRPETLDRALVRPGRFDRQILVDCPDLHGRRAILAVHARRVQLDPTVDLDLVARRTPGAVGADLANVVNEAALAAARRDAVAVSALDFEEALDRIQLGLKKHSRMMTQEEKRRVAHHEAGHAVVALSVEHSDPLHRVTIIPRSIGALGATLQLPTEDRFLVTRAELHDRICILMGGRTAELLACGDTSTGAQNDLEIATETARQMVCRFGMSEAIGPQLVGAAGGEAQRVAAWLGEGERHPSDATAALVDREVRRILDAESERAHGIVRKRRALLDLLAAELIEHETLERPAIDALVRQAVALEKQLPSAAE